ncbi:MAG: hypothetical protein KDA52_10860 [Planctomycetaceae bacterium]|nr:hypothetical protein [Planctomycetaceae bacterium]
MMTKLRVVALASLLTVAVVGWQWSQSETLYAAQPQDVANDAEPVESDMHEFMEYVFQPTYLRLKPLMSVTEPDNKTWKSIKADSLILAEGGNLLLIRQPEENAVDWVKHSVHVRDFGGQLYRAAKAKDYPLARKNYESMVENCNACHHQFAHGEHILNP